MSVNLNKVTRRTFVAGSAAIAAGAAVCGPMAALATEIQTYTAQAMGKKGPVSVEVDFDGGKIVEVRVVACEDTKRIAGAAIASVPQAIVEAQSLDVDCAAGATFTSMAILNAVEDCVAQAGVTLEAVPSNVPETPALVRLEADVAVCGAGGAGMAAALTGAQEGLNVVVLEKASYMGGNVLVSGGWLEAMEGYENRRPEMTDGYRILFESTLESALEKGIDPDFVAQVQDDFNAYYEAGGTRVFDSHGFYAIDYATRNGGPVQQYWLPFAEKVDNLNEWLVGQGYEMTDNLVGIVGFPWPRKAHAKGKPNGEGFFDVYEQTMEAADLPLTMLYSTPAQELIVEDGKVVGVRGTAQDGTVYEVITARGVILATGGYSGNPEMMMKYNEMWPWNEDTFVPTSNNYGHTGDGILMAEAVGAKLANIGKQMVFPIADCIDFSTETIVGAGGLGMYVNTDGDRFANETANRFALSALVMQQPGEKLYIISDSENSGIVDGLNDNGYPVEKLLAEGKLYTADTLEDLAAQLGMDPERFVANVERYNAAARGEVEDEFGRGLSPKDVIDAAPFYASPRRWAAHVTMGGVAIDPDYRALDEQGAPIEGLYVVGECSDGNSGISSSCTGRACILGMLA